MMQTLTRNLNINQQFEMQSNLKKLTFSSTFMVCLQKEIVTLILGLILMTTPMSTKMHWTVLFKVLKKTTSKFQLINHSWLAWERLQAQWQRNFQVFGAFKLKSIVQSQTIKKIFQNFKNFFTPFSIGSLHLGNKCWVKFSVIYLSKWWIVLSLSTRPCHQKTINFTFLIKMLKKNPNIILFS